MAERDGDIVGPVVIASGSMPSSAGPTNTPTCPCVPTWPICASNFVTYPSECHMTYCSGYPPGTLYKLYDGPCVSQKPHVNSGANKNQRHH